MNLCIGSPHTRLVSGMEFCSGSFRLSKSHWVTVDLHFLSNLASFFDYDNFLCRYLTLGFAGSTHEVAGFLLEILSSSLCAHWD